MARLHCLATEIELMAASVQGRCAVIGTSGRERASLPSRSVALDQRQIGARVDPMHKPASRGGNWLVVMLLTSRHVSHSASQAAAFFREVAGHRTVWYVTDDEGSPALKTFSGRRAFPYWSSQARAQRAAKTWGGGLRAIFVPLETWRSEELPELAAEDYLIGINWTGPRLVGWDFTVPEVLNRLAHSLREGPYSEDSAPDG